MNLNYDALGQRIREIRKVKGWTQAQLAESSGIEPSNISHIERAATKLSLQTLVSIANALEVSIDELMYDSINKNAYISRSKISDLLSDCTDKELCIITDIICAAKVIMRK